MITSIKIKRVGDMLLTFMTPFSTPGSFSKIQMKLCKAESKLFLKTMNNILGPMFSVASFIVARCLRKLN
eukprot:snap_masked-scaffold_99-processed-gene-0.21-mRNA-1 protein AED:1.00 eAED:1.00 QI:0/0/0/0/1/1/3/0/69